MLDALFAPVPVCTVGIVFVIAVAAVLSFRQEPAARKRKPKDTARPDDGLKRVLVVEDSPEQAHVLARGLRANLPGAEVDIALSGEEALVMIASNRYTAVVVDVGLRGIGGATFVRLASRQHPELAAVLLSDHAPESLDEIARSCGAVASFAKPADSAQIATALGPFLSE